MKKKNTSAFTLIELLAVLVILAIIALIVFPIIGDVISDSKLKAFKSSVEGLEHAIDLDYQKDYYKGEREYSYENGNLVLNSVKGVDKSKNIKVEGIIENGNGTLSVDKNGNTLLIVSNDEYCATKYYTDKTVIVEEKTDEECMIRKTLSEIMQPLIGESVNNNDPDHNLRYVGSDPDNYVWFNNELWRIIGVFDGKAKIIRDEYYSTEIVWDDGSDETLANYWPIASLKSLLNDGETSYLKTIQTNDPTSYGYIDLEHVWTFAGPPSSEVPVESEKTRSNMYVLERKTSVNGEHPTTWIGAVGLMYPSDYGYSTSSTSENCNLNMWAWNSYSECYENSWIYDNNYYQWTMTPRIDTSQFVFRLTSGGTIFAAYCADVYGYIYQDVTSAARPVLYLKSDTKMVGGQGTKTKPFILAQ